MNNHAWINDPQIRNNAIITITTHSLFKEMFCCPR